MRGKVQTAERLLALGAAVAPAATQPQLQRLWLASLCANIMLTSSQSSAKPPTEPCKMGLINRFLAASEGPILHADGRLWR